MLCLEPQELHAHREEVRKEAKKEGVTSRANINVEVDSEAGVRFSRC